jgi:hypothetical protein
MRLPNWQAARTEDWLGEWAMNLLLLLNIATRRFVRAVRLPEGDVPAKLDDSRSKVVSRLAPVRRVCRRNGRPHGRRRICRGSRSARDQHR